MPMDATYPPRRLELMAQQTGAMAIIASRAEIAVVGNKLENVATRVDSHIELPVAVDGGGANDDGSGCGGGTSASPRCALYEYESAVESAESAIHTDTTQPVELRTQLPFPRCVLHHSLAHNTCSLYLIVLVMLHLCECISKRRTPDSDRFSPSQIVSSIIFVLQRKFSMSRGVYVWQHGYAQGGCGCAPRTPRVCTCEECSLQHR